MQNIHIMFSVHVHFWHLTAIIVRFLQSTFPLPLMGHHIFFVMDDIRHYDLTILWHQVGVEVETIKISKDAMPENKAPECPAAPFEG